MWRVIESEMSASYAIVPGDYGAQYQRADGTMATFQPLPLCRVPWGRGRTKGEAHALAVVLCNALHVHAPETARRGGGAEPPQ